MVVRFTPFDVKGAAIHDNLRLPTGTACDKGGYSSSTSPSATCHRNAAATFPDTGSNRIICLDTGKLYITALWEGGVMLQYASGLAHLVYIVCEDDVMRIAH